MHVDCVIHAIRERLPARPVLDRTADARHFCHARYQASSFLPEFHAELSAFPKSAHGDLEDALVQGAGYATGSSGGPGFFKWLAEEEARKIAERLLPPEPPGGN